MGPRVIEWDGAHIPETLKGLPPGRYVIESVDSPLPLTEEEERGILAALEELDGGKGIPLADVVRQIKDKH